MAIADYVDKHNGNPKPFVGTAKAGPTSSKASNAPTKRSILADLIAAHTPDDLRETLEAGVYLAGHLQSAALMESP